MILHELDVLMTVTDEHNQTRNEIIRKNRLVEQHEIAMQLKTYPGN